MNAPIDITFDFRSDTPPDRDPDALSPTLRRYHKLLWGRPLPNGKPFDLDDSAPIRRRYLSHRSELGEFHLSSDTVFPCYTSWKRMQPIIARLSEAELCEFRAARYTIGGMTIWPVRSHGHVHSINAARGFDRRIMDRMDLTLECIRRYYRNEPSPLSVVLTANSAFFGLFANFAEFVDHFLWQDLVTDDGSAVKFFTPFDDFQNHLLPGDIDSYRDYRARSIEHIHARNQRILALSKTL